MMPTENTSSAGKSSVDLSDSAVRRRLSLQIKAGIDAYCVKAYDDGHRSHLGGSRIGNKCARALWYEFRWARKEVFDGRKLRLFNRGHREEERFVEWLRGMGCTVQTHTVDGNQIRIAAVDDHFGGSLDGLLNLPAGLDVGCELLLECKTQGTGAGFAKLLENGVKFEKPVHYAQMSTYGRARGIRYALYLAINKNDDDLHVEVVELDWKLAEDNERKADKIIRAEIPPQRISETPTSFDCKWCHFSPICHSGEVPERNCRTCMFSIPIENGQWGCRHWNEVIPKEELPKGCSKHQRLF
jgi:hypothetical protein